MIEYHSCVPRALQKPQGTCVGNQDPASPHAAFCKVFQAEEKGAACSQWAAAAQGVRAWLKLLMAPRRTTSAHRASSTAASQVTTHSMVAMLGWIMPDPLAKPPARTLTPPISVCRRVQHENSRPAVTPHLSARDDFAKSWQSATRQTPLCGDCYALMSLLRNRISSFKWQEESQLDQDSFSCMAHPRLEHVHEAALAHIVCLQTLH